MLRDLELLEVEIDTNWLRDERGRLVRQRTPIGFAAPHLALAVAMNGKALALGKDVPAALAAELETLIAAEPLTGDPSLRPAVLDRCRDVLTRSIGPATIRSGPSYVIERGTTFPPTTELQRSDRHDIELLSKQDIERLNWPADEWRQLLAGDLGPWAMGIVDRRVIAICHCARLTDRGAELGVWTDPDFRGQGHAAAVTAAWASLLAPRGRHLFYSTSATNFSSQRVAARLKLRPIGWMWQLVPLIVG